MNADNGFIATRWQVAAWHLSPFEMTPALTYSDGASLFKQGDVSRDVFFLEHGLIKVIFLDPNGDEVIVSLQSAPGSLIGASCAILGKHYVSATVVTRSTRLRRVAAIAFNDFIKQDANASWALHVQHCRGNAELLERSAEFDYLSVRQRAEQLIWNLSEACELTPTDKGLRMELPLKYRELAQLIKVSPEHLCRVVGTIEKAGLIRRDKGWLYLIDRDRLFHRKPS